MRRETPSPVFPTVIKFNDGDIEQIKEGCYSLRKVNVFYKNEPFILSEKLKGLVTIVRKTGNKVQVLFQTEFITYQDVMSDILANNDIIEFENDDNVLEQLIEGMVLKEEL